MGYSENISNSTFKLTLLLSQIVVKTECLCAIIVCIHHFKLWTIEWLKHNY